MIVAAGFGFRAGATLASLRDALGCATGNATVTHLATLEDKTDLLADLAKELCLPVVAVPPASLELLPTLTQSSISRSARGTGSVAEACALAAAGGEDARLLGPRSLSPDRMATCAIAQGVSP